MISFWYQLGFFLTVICVLQRVWLSKTRKEWWQKRQRLLEVASKLPGPRGLPLIGSALAFAGTSEELLRTISMLCKPYSGSSRFWLGPKLMVVVKTPNDIGKVLQSENAACKESMLYRIVENLFGRGLVTSSGPTHKMHRKLILGKLNGKTVGSFVEYFDRHSQRCVEQLEDRVDSGEFDVSPFLKDFIMDMVMDTIMGVPENVQQDGNKEFIVHISRMYNLVADRLFKIWLHPDWIWALTKYSELQNKALRYIHQFEENIIAQKKKDYHVSKEVGSDTSNEPRLKLLEQLIAYNEENHLMDDERLRDEIHTVLVAAEDSTLTMISFLFLMLAMHPEVQHKVRSELNQVLGKESMTANALSKLIYLETVIKETLRLFPLAPLLSRELTGDVDLESCTLPKGCSVLMVPFLVHRDPVYWANPNSFEPDRFKPENSRGRHTYAYVPFSGGLRGCIGKHFGMLLIKATVANVLRKYRLHCNATLDELDLKFDLVLRSVHGYKISITRV